MKKFLLFLVLMFFALCLTACGPTTTELSLNTSITQSTTSSSTTSSSTTNNYVPVTHIMVELDQAEVCIGAQVALTVTITPSNATNLTYTVILSQTTMVDFVGTNQLLIEAIDDDPSGEIGETIITVISDDNGSITDVKQIYVHPSGAGVCP